MIDQLKQEMMELKERADALVALADSDEFAENRQAKIVSEERGLIALQVSVADELAEIIARRIDLRQREAGGR